MTCPNGTRKGEKRKDLLYPRGSARAGSSAQKDLEPEMRRDLDDVIQGWPYDPEPGEVLAREVRARDGRMVLQIRVELGVLQLEVSGRPDGLRPHGCVTYLDYLRHSAASRGQAPGGKSPPWMMSATPCHTDTVAPAANRPTAASNDHM